MTEYAHGNRAELLFTEWARSQGWEVTKRGWPDFICRRSHELMCVEVKDGSDHLSTWQQQTATDLATRGIPVHEWRPPNAWDPEDGQLRLVSPVQRVMNEERISVFAAADKAVRESENARLLAEDDNRRLTRQVAVLRAARARDSSSASTGRDETARLRADNDRLIADSGYLLRHILDCRRHYISTRVEALMRRYREALRSDMRPLPDGGFATVEPCGTGWPGRPE
jgi:hypothetical protein